MQANYRIHPFDTAVGKKIFSLKIGKGKEFITGGH